MWGTLRPDQKQVTVIGAGISGLLIAYRLDQLGYEVSLLEATSRGGGLISSLRSSLSLSESAANSILSSPEVLQLFRELDVPWTEIRKEAKGFKGRKIYRDGRMTSFPLSIGEFFATLGHAIKRVPTPPEASLADWGQCHLGPAATEYLLTPMMRGIYAAHPRELALDLAFPKLRVPEGTSLLGHLRGLKRKNKSDQSPERPRMIAPVRGMQQLTDALTEHLKKRLGNRFQLGIRISSQRFGELNEGRGNLIVTLPTHAAAPLFQAIHPSLSQTLARVPYSRIESTTVVLERSGFPTVPRGVGVLIPEQEDAHFHGTLGVLLSSSTFEGRAFNLNHVTLTALRKPGSQADLENDLQTLFRYSGPLLEVRSHLWKNAIPIYGPEIGAARKEALSSWAGQPGRLFFGNYTGQVSIRGLIQSVSSIPIARSV